MSIAAQHDLTHWVPAGKRGRKRSISSSSDDSRCSSVSVGVQTDAPQPPRPPRLPRPPRPPAIIVAILVVTLALMLVLMQPRRMSPGDSFASCPLPASYGDEPHVRMRLRMLAADAPKESTSVTTHSMRTYAETASFAAAREPRGWTTAMTMTTLLASSVLRLMMAHGGGGGRTRWCPSRSSSSVCQGAAARMPWI